MHIQEMLDYLSLTDPSAIKDLFKKAYQCKLENVGNKVYYRGIVEFSNICSKDCYYCGIRSSNHKVARYIMDQADIIEAGTWAWEKGYGSIVLQSGERTDQKFIDFIDAILLQLKQKTRGELGITLSLGEQSRETYKRWYESGAHRYLLRIETSDPELYKTFHPHDHSYQARIQSLLDLKDLGYQTGSGVMIGLPGQSLEHLARDIRFFKEIDLDMIGMGPYIPHSETPLAHSPLPLLGKEDRFMLALKMIAVTRLTLQDVNIAATTALQALDPRGREKGIEAGANIVMPNITPVEYREDYKLYEDKPCTDENASQCISCLDNRIRLTGESVGYGEWGDAPHVLKKKKDIKSGSAL